MAESKGNAQCKECGNEVQQKKGKKLKKFCSTACRLNWWKHHQELLNHKANYEFVCKNCGQKFTAYGNNHRQFCSHGCYIQSRFRKGNVMQDLDSGVKDSDKRKSYTTREKIGDTEFIITVEFSENARETPYEKIKRLILEDYENSKWEARIKDNQK